MTMTFKSILQLADVFKETFIRLFILIVGETHNIWQRFHALNIDRHTINKFQAERGSLNQHTQFAHSF